MKKHTLKYVEFYITNVCNLNCSNCNRFNNYYFSGHQRWNDYKEIYNLWSKKIDIRHIAILGGEPSLNPSLKDWIKGISKLWPNSKLSILTNGTRFKYISEIYPLLHQHNSDVIIEVSVHTPSEYEKIIQNAENFLHNNVKKINYNLDKKYETWQKSYNDIKEKHWQKCNIPSDFKNLPITIQQECENIHNVSPSNHFSMFNGVRLIDDNNKITINISPSYGFKTASITLDDNGTFNLYNNNPIEAHNICYSKQCHHFIKGKLYKCLLVGILPEFISQFDVNITNNDASLLNSYAPLTINNTSEEMKNFIDHLSNMIPQCKFCPSNFMNVTSLNASTKKIKIKKK